MANFWKDILHQIVVLDTQNVTLITLPKTFFSETPIFLSLWSGKTNFLKLIRNMFPWISELQISNPSWNYSAQSLVFDERKRNFITIVFFVNHLFRTCFSNFITWRFDLAECWNSFSAIKKIDGKFQRQYCLLFTFNSIFFVRSPVFWLAFDGILWFLQIH